MVHYNVDLLSTSFTVVKLCRPRLVLGWVTTRKDLCCEPLLCSRHCIAIVVLESTNQYFVDAVQAATQHV